MSHCIHRHANKGIVVEQEMVIVAVVQAIVEHHPECLLHEAVEVQHQGKRADHWEHFRVAVRCWSLKMRADDLQYELCCSLH